MTVLIEQRPGIELAIRVIVSYTQSIARYPMKVELTEDLLKVYEYQDGEIDDGNPSIDRPFTWHKGPVFTIFPHSERDAGILIGVRGKNIKVLRDLIHIIGSQQNFLPMRIVVNDPLSQNFQGLKTNARSSA